jgi:RNA polymerase sigma-70 factor, ECF subfamily
VQECFVRLWQGAGRFDPGRGTVRGLLFTIARRVAIDLHRRPSSRAFAPEVEDAGAFDARADEVLLSVTVRDAMSSLSPAHREVLELVYDEDLKLSDIAVKLDVPLGTVKTRAFYALRAMRDALRERGFDG